MDSEVILLLEFTEISYNFVANFAASWIRSLQKNEKWRYIKQVEIVVESTMLRNIMELFYMNDEDTLRVTTFHSSLEKACEKVNVDSNLVL